jgi:hypothetical protein
MFSQYYSIGETSHWENGNHILQRSMEMDEFASMFAMDVKSARNMIDRWNSILLEERSKRIPPGTDDKSLTSWSSLMISGLVKASHALDNHAYLDLAVKIATQIRNSCLGGETGLFRSFKSGNAYIPGFHIDYALYIEASIDLYSATLDTKWLNLALTLTDAAFEMFFDQKSGLFNFNSDQVEVPVGNQAEVQDNVIPSSNSVMGHNLFRLGHLMGRADFQDTALSMLNLVQELFEQHSYSHSNWGRLLLRQIYPFYEVAVTGKDAPVLVKEVLKEYRPNLVVAGTTTASELPLFKNRYDHHKSYIFVCRDHVCQLPYTEINDAKNVFHIG